MIVGVTGFFCAGKDTVAEILMRRGLAHVSLSDMIRDEIRRRGEEITIPRLTEVGNALRTDHGPGVLAERALAVLPSEGDAVVTSIRHGGEVEALRRGRPDFRMLFVDAPARVRYERSLSRRRSGDPATFEEFRDAERAQMESGDPNSQQLLRCRDMADLVVQNEGSTEDLEAAINRALKNLSEPPLPHSTPTDS
ncbi:AAA family ATPase [Candidatus Sumerlaeota bacterium]|nr:AAA family ATPase [Candidatus Sumerlaeota bacterium]